MTNKSRYQLQSHAAAFNAFSLARYKNAKRVSPTRALAFARERVFRRDVHPEPVWRVFRYLHCDRRGTRSSWKTVTKVDGEKKDNPAAAVAAAAVAVAVTADGVSGGCLPMNCGQAWTSSATLHIAGTWYIRTCGRVHTRTHTRVHTHARTQASIAL